MLDGTALRAFDAVAMDDIEVSGGQQVIFDTLDGHFPEEASHDRIGEVLDNVFDLKVELGEATAVFTGKVRAAFSAAEAGGVADIAAALRTTIVLRKDDLLGCTGRGGRDLWP